MNTDDLRSQPEWREFETVVEETLAKVRKEATKPYRRLLIWLDIFFALLFVVSVAQLILWLAAR
jgi:hypothetical protein